MKIGPFRHRVAIQVNTPTRNNIGESVPAWATAATFWGRIEPLGGRELEIAKAVNAQATTRISLRYVGNALGASGLTARHRLAYIPGAPAGAPTRYFDINDVSNLDERNKTLVCICTEAK